MAQPNPLLWLAGQIPPAHGHFIPRRRACCPHWPCDHHWWERCDMEPWPELYVRELSVPAETLRGVRAPGSATDEPSVELPARVLTAAPRMALQWVVGVVLTVPQRSGRRLLTLAIRLKDPDLLPRHRRLSVRVLFQVAHPDGTFPPMSAEQSFVLDPAELRSEAFFYPEVGWADTEVLELPSAPSRSWKGRCRLLLWGNFSEELEPLGWARESVRLAREALPPPSPVLLRLWDACEAGAAGELVVDTADGRLRTSADLLIAQSPFMAQFVQFYERLEDGEPASRRARRSVDFTSYSSGVVRLALRHAFTGDLEPQALVPLGLGDLKDLLCLMGMLEVPGWDLVRAVAEAELLSRELGEAAEVAEALCLAELHGLPLLANALLLRVARRPLHFARALPPSALAPELWDRAERLSEDLLKAPAPVQGDLSVPTIR